MKKLKFEKINEFTYKIFFKWEPIGFLENWHKVFSGNFGFIPDENNKYILCFWGALFSYSFYANLSQVVYYLNKYITNSEVDFKEKILLPDIKTANIQLFDDTVIENEKNHLSNLHTLYFDDNYCADYFIEDLEAVINNNGI